MKKSQKVALIFMLFAIVSLAAFPPTLKYKKTSALDSTGLNWLDEDYVLDHYFPRMENYFETRRFVFRTRTSRELRTAEIEVLGKVHYTDYIKYSIDPASLLAEIIVVVCLGMAVFVMSSSSRNKKENNK